MKNWNTIPRSIRKELADKNMFLILNFTSTMAQGVH